VTAIANTVPARPRVIFLGGEGLHYEEHAPGPALSPWIQAFWRLRCDRPFALRVLPDGCMDIIGSDVVGSLTTALVANLEAGDEATGIRFRPGAFTALYGVPASELSDLRVPLADVVRPRSLLKVVRDAQPPDPLAGVALQAGDVRSLARETGYSPRHLHRRLVAATGHSPKRLARIGRMQALLASGRGESWARTASEFGFYDESHMINDIRALANATPQSLLGDRGAA
jgi:AraC-like DNA-binding protein